MTDVLGGQVPLIIDTVTAVRSHVADGKLKALGVTALKSTELMPSVKSIAEQGAPDFEVTAWNAFYAPRDTPRAVIERPKPRTRQGVGSIRDAKALAGTGIRSGRRNAGRSCSI